jgi:glutamate-1-semialdehyde aminotransferase
MILGHANQNVVKAVEKALHKGLGFGAPTQIETRFINSDFIKVILQSNAFPILN